MKSMRKIFPIPKLIIILFLVLILIYPSYSIQGAKLGLLLWFNTVLPTLLPFIIISNLIVKLQITNYLSKLLYPLFHLIFGVSKGGCYPILIGFLSGIPVGAKSVADLTSNKSITEEEGQFLLGFCNNASPMFIMSYIAISQLQMPSLRFILLLILYSSACIASMLYFKLFNRFNPSKRTKYNLNNNSLISAQSSDTTSTIQFNFAQLDTSIMNGFEVITKVGGYIILFSIPAQIITNLIESDSIPKLIAIGILEITTGINQIALSNLSLELKIVLTTMLTAFGGLSAVAQTKSVINDTRLSLDTYIKVRILTMLIALLLTYMYTAFIL